MITSRIEYFAKYAGLATVAVEWSALVIYYLKMPLYFGDKYPISYYATLPQTKWVFSTCYVLAAIFCWVFTRHHLAKYFRLPLKVFGISMVLFAATGLYPYDPNNTVSAIIHTALALSSGLLYLGGMYALARHTKDKTVFITTILAIILSFSLTIAFILAPRGSHLIFSFEAGSWLVLQLWMIWISFYIHRHRTLI